MPAERGLGRIADVKFQAAKRKRHARSCGGTDNATTVPLVVTVEPVCGDCGLPA